MHRTALTWLMFAVFVAVLGSIADSALGQEQLDWCAPMVVRPDQRFYTTNPCEPAWPDDEIARRADFVLDGFLRPSTSSLTPDQSSCFGPNTMEASGAYHDRLRTAASSYGRSLTILYLSRLDIVDRHTAGTPGFDDDYLVPASRTRRQATDFFWRDTSPTCACGCEWSDDIGPSGVGDPPGERLVDLIDAVGGAGAHETKITYGTRPSTGGSLAGAPRLFFGVATIADQTNASYRAWRIEHMRDAIDNGGYDAVMLNDKFHQYQPVKPPIWWDDELAPDVAAYLAGNEGLWSSPPVAYGYRDYLAGWAAFADDLDAANIPFSLALSPFVWRANYAYDDPATPEFDEAETIRAVARRARWVFLERYSQFTPAEFDAVIDDIESAGVATVVPIDADCGYGSPPGRTPPPLTASLGMAPDAAVTATFAATSLLAKVGGTATGPWDADLWCNCAAPPCGAPNASTTGELGTQWLPPLGVCDVGYRIGVGRRNPRLEVRRAGFTATSRRAVHVCAPACGNGRDDDRDGAADFPDDPGCSSALDANETTTALVCDDGRDNDIDGRIDFPDDAQCLNATGKEVPPWTACGLGAELGLVVPLLARWRSRRRATARLDAAATVSGPTPPL